jgi:subtilase family serine protease
MFKRDLLMTQYSTAFRPIRRFFLVSLLALIAFAAPVHRALGQVADRIPASLSATDTTALKGSLHPLARAQYDQGRAAASTPLSYMTMTFAPSATQEAALQALLAAQQNPASPLYHKWLTPAQFGAQFGMSSNDIATAEAWLQAQGFTVLDVANGRNAIHFSGTVAQVDSAFHTEMHRYLVNGTTHLANSTELTLPSGLAGAVAGVHGIAQFRPHPLHTAVRHFSADAAKPQLTSSSGNNYLAPSDTATIYDIKALYNAGYTGTGASLAIVGQSAIQTSDIDTFRSASNLPAKDPVLTLVPGTGVSTLEETSGDEDESDIDLEWSGAIAQNATVNFVYVGNSTSAGVFDALAYAIDQDLAPIVSISYGECEPEAGSDPATLEPIFMQANAQGQTLVASAGDSGATGCDNGVTSATLGLAVSYPASSAYFTAMGGTEYNEGSASYWNSTNDAGGGSAIFYIPEEAWNETAASNALNPPNGLSSGGGGKSILFGKPTWQVATNVPADGVRDVPDISLDAASIHDGYIFCSNGSCTGAFTHASVAGGTSFDAPIFSGILALINEKNNSTGAGNINGALYSLYSTAPTAFHDISVGNNEQPCSSGSIDCPAGTTEIGYATGAGYDLATGLGSIDAYNLAQVFPASVSTGSGSPIATATTLTASNPTPIAGQGVSFTAGVSAESGTVAPTGTVNFVVDGGAAITATLSNGTATLPSTTFAAGTHTVVATYVGDSTYATSSSTLTITVAAAATGSFSMTATNVTVASGSAADTTVTITGTGGYTGEIGFQYSVSPTSFTGCLFANETGVGTNGVVATQIEVDTLASDCTSSGVRHNMLKRITPKTGSVASAATPAKPVGSTPEYPIAAAAVLAGLALLGRKRKAWPVAVLLVIGGLGTLSGCGGSSGTPITTSPSSTYTITLTGTDTNNLSTSTTFTVTVQ